MSFILGPSLEVPGKAWSTPDYGLCCLEEFLEGTTPKALLTLEPLESLSLHSHFPLNGRNGSLQPDVGTFY